VKTGIFLLSILALVVIGIGDKRVEILRKTSASISPQLPQGACASKNGTFFESTCEVGEEPNIQDCQREVDNLTLPQSFFTYTVANVSCSFGGQTCTGQGRITISCCPDRDSDGYSDKACGGSDCDDGNANINPSKNENCSNGVDDDCDDQTDLDDSQCSCPQTCTGGPIESGCYLERDPCRYPNNDGCPPNMFSWGNCCCTACPIIIDVNGNGFDLTNAPGGVDFDHNNDGIRERISWTEFNSDDAFLTLDRNGNGTIDGGRELFGNSTPQPVTSEPHGFIALTEYDKPVNGGDNDGKIDRRDAIFSSLRLWQDTNHNGISEPSELSRLSRVGLASIDLDYRESKRADQHGNQFRYRAKVRDSRGAHLGRWAWDVFFLRQ
jgi:hypothetical protein